MYCRYIATVLDIIGGVCLSLHLYSCKIPIDKFHVKSCYTHYWTSSKNYKTFSFADVPHCSQHRTGGEGGTKFVSSMYMNFAVLRGMVSSVMSKIAVWVSVPELNSSDFIKLDSPITSWLFSIEALRQCHYRGKLEGTNSEYAYLSQRHA